ncbi:NAD(P)H-dependent oxidoreductase subunit E [Nisaea acidiphila]|uniref:NAD(P)H-dependent oxidoreductase subunit E n=1 Tax=Nisaea acidiphila TaxID=1862145 RepID=A0A9J7ARJ5_9PROT|nr:NAD(P)H-dependent oxidoreductase subunit E [Nisaea acidiphila]UUX48964.1 NAD(P)H-dependent oxidoreductase subunit E [Nisaea acidiphila]
MSVSEEIPGAREARAICATRSNDPSMLLEILHDLQVRVGHIPGESVPILADCLNLSKAEVYGVVSFYHDFRTEPGAPITVRICQAEACRSMGAEALTERLLSRYGVSLSEISAAGVTFEPVYCLGNCALAPAAMVDGALIGRADGAAVDAAIAEAGR